MDKRVLNLKQRPQYEQRTPEWYDVRRSLITASSAASLLIRDKATCSGYVKEYDLDDVFDYNKKCCNPYSNKTQFMLDKCKQSSFKGNIATYWGQKYEPVVTDLYSNLTNKPVMEFGLIVHEKYKWLGASPDGITPDGIMIEIKCPFRRKITGVPPLYYYIQVQLQLEVCDLEYCDFVEYEFTEFESEEEFLDDETLDQKVFNKGIFIKVEKLENKDIPCDPSQIQYIYPEKEFLDKEQDLLKWAEVQMKNLPEMIDEKFKKEIIKITPVYWKVTDKSIVRIKRDKGWFENTRPVLEREYNNLVYYQKGDNYKKLLAKEKTYVEGTTLHIELTDDECLFSDNNTEASDDD